MFLATVKLSAPAETATGSNNNLTEQIRKVLNLNMLQQEAEPFTPNDRGSIENNS